MLKLNIAHKMFGPTLLRSMSRSSACVPSILNGLISTSTPTNAASTLNVKQSVLLKPATNVKNLISSSNFSSSSTIPTSSEQNNFIQIEDHKSDGYIVLKLNKPPVNSLSLELLTDLNIQMEKIEKANDFHGVILTSNSADVFCAGLDIMEMYQAKPERMRQFWTALQEFWINLYGSNKIFIAAINGHAPAGGCLLSLCCDYRLMSKGRYKIGLNETLLGIVAPFWFRDSFINAIGFRQTEMALQLGKLFSPEEALAIKLVDEICEPKDLMTKAQSHMADWIKIPSIARELTKSSMRRDTISKLLSRREADTESFVEMSSKDFVQNTLKTYLDSLKKKKAPSAAPKP